MAPASSDHPHARSAEALLDKRAWLRRIPPEDVESFAGGYDTIARRVEPFGRAALVIVDMTRAFVDDAYPTGWGDTGWPAVRVIAQLLAAARENDVPVYFTKAFAHAGHLPVRGQNGRWKPSQDTSPVPGVPPGDEIVEELQPLPHEIVIHKQRKPSAFFGTTLAADLLYDGIETVILVGMTTSGCVRASALDAFQFNFRVVVVDDACADRSQISHSVALFDLHMKYADVIGSQEALAGLGAATAAS
jgi:maleamate amidohydrolase